MRPILTALGPTVLTAVLTAAPLSAGAAPNPPEPGEHHYDMKGYSTLGALPPQLLLTVGEVGGGAQQWRLDASNPDSTGVVEELTVSRHADGYYLSAYHLQAAGSAGGIDLTFVPAVPALLVPAGPRGSWNFDMRSTDGCAISHTEGSTPKDPKSPGLHLHLVTTANGTGKADCLPFQGKRVQDVRFPVASMLPMRIDNDLSGKVGGAPAKLQYTAMLRKGP
ncbi:MAG TPA: hypothetical protein VHV82_10375 [Sporichthyaceae bacterium]|jgi:hypothetical protein|nr:hypothetical protein [Sporichthyaceae bacterium]